MALRPLNDTLFIELDENHFVDSNPEVVRIAQEGLIQLPDHNTLEKVANTGTIISWGDKCRYSSHYKVGLRVMFKQFGGESFFHEEKKLRCLLEDELLAIYD